MRRILRAWHRVVGHFPVFTSDGFHHCMSCLRTWPVGIKQ